MALPAFDDVGKVSECPVYHGAASVHEGKAALRDGVLHARRHFGEGETLHHAVFFKMAKRHGEYFLRDVGQAFAEGGKSHVALAVAKRVEHEQRPFVAHPRYDVAHVTFGKEYVLYLKIFNHMQLFR